MSWKRYIKTFTVLFAFRRTTVFVRGPAEVEQSGDRSKRDQVVGRGVDAGRKDERRGEVRNEVAEAAFWGASTAVDLDNDGRRIERAERGREGETGQRGRHRFATGFESSDRVDRSPDHLDLQSTFSDTLSTSSDRHSPSGARGGRSLCGHIWKDLSIDPAMGIGRSRTRTVVVAARRRVVVPASTPSVIVVARRAVSVAVVAACITRSHQLSVERKRGGRSGAR